MDTHMKPSLSRLIHTKLSQNELLGSYYTCIILIIGKSELYFLRYSQLCVLWLTYYIF